MKFKFKWNYKSSLGGPWLKGDVVDFNQELAEAINRDSPGVLEDVGEKTPVRENRMKADAQYKRKAKANHKEEEITKETFKAVKDGN